MSEVKPEQEKTKAKTRGHYEQKECPYCHKIFGNLGNHINLKHPTEAKPKPELTKETLLRTPLPSIRLTKYFCLNCRAVLRKGEETCWQCGQRLNWEGIE